MGNHYSVIFSLLWLSIVAALMMASSLDAFHDLKYLDEVGACYNRAVSESMSMKVDPLHGSFELLSNLSSLSFNSLVNDMIAMQRDFRQFVFIGDSVMKQQMVVFGCMVDPRLDFGGCILKVEAQQISECHIQTSIMHLHLFKIGKKFNDYDRLERILRGILSFNSSASHLNLSNRDVVVINQGLHHTSAPELDELKNLSVSIASVYRDAVKHLPSERVPKFVWRETTPQHYRTCNGWFDPNVAANHREQCLTDLNREMESGLSSTSGGLNCTAASLRNGITVPIMESAGIAVSRVYQPLKSAGVNLHLQSSLKKDCTHYQVDALIFMNQMLLSSVRG